MDLPFDIRTIMQYLPHRYPFLMVDRILELIPGQKVVALKNVTINEAFFQGHYPGMPIMPGVLVVEAMGQAGGVLAFASLPEERKGVPIYFMAMDRVKFRRPVVPGDQLILEVKILKQKMKAIKMTGTAMVDNALAAEGELMATFGDNL